VTLALPSLARWLALLVPAGLLALPVMPCCCPTPPPTASDGAEGERGAPVMIWRFVSARAAEHPVLATA